MDTTPRAAATNGTNNSPETTVYIVDDDHYARTGLSTMIQTEPGIRVIGSAGNGHDGAVGIIDAKPDVALVDLHMPDLDGPEVIKAVKKANVDTALVVLTAHEAESELLRAINNGAAGYLLKGDPEALFPAIRAAARGGSPIDPAMSGRLMRRMNPNADEVLTAREIEILEAGKLGASYDDIAHELYISRSTVEKHVGSIHAKLQVTNRTAALWRAIQLGILRRPLP